MNKYKQGWKEINMDVGKAKWRLRDFLFIASLVFTAIISVYFSL